MKKKVWHHKPIKKEPAVKGDLGKLRMDLIPVYPTLELAKIYTYGVWW